ncbi:MAG: Serine/threonine protein kinase [Hydrogenibacillus schlegelii]|uniref:Serine/threonine protein kinase n=1 Tax=Hydrogenibacillus schlegelii TaxID=1484 RepID=A0A2T5G7S4_HYDSH|nr:RDD family protein [Hydrogenibacillus schlegelii]PTQ52240.1 MAG: Serine/threonine protein kinase [Hydrogenibacillus schlegelii]
MKTVDVLPDASGVYTTVPATFFQLAFAWFIDRIMLFVFQLFIVLLFLGFSLLVAVASGSESIGIRVFFSGLGLVFALIITVSWFLYRFFTESRMNGQTIGKRLLGVRVVKENGLPATTRDIFVRELVYVLFGMIPYLGFLIFLVNVILVAFTEKKQALHDLIAKTMVVPAQ